MYGLLLLQPLQLLFVLWPNRKLTEPFPVLFYLRGESEASVYGLPGFRTLDAWRLVEDDFPRVHGDQARHFLRPVCALGSIPLRAGLKVNPSRARSVHHVYFA